MALLLDSDVLIDYLRAQAAAVAYLDNLSEPLLISVMTVAELYAGVREGTERASLEQFLSAFTIISLDDEIARKGGLYRRDFGKSHGVGLVDALIAASAELHHSTLVTLNSKHFPMLANILVPYQKL